MKKKTTYHITLLKGKDKMPYGYYVKANNYKEAARMLGIQKSHML